MPIEQLLERYFNADTTVREEKQLREYFASGDVPAHLLKYRALFEVIGESTCTTPVQPTNNKPSRVIRFYHTLRPLLRATACVAIMLAVVMIAEQGVTENQSTSVLTPTNSQTVGIEVSEWDGMSIVECPTDSLPNEQQP